MVQKIQLSENLKRIFKVVIMIARVKTVKRLKGRKSTVANHKPARALLSLSDTNSLIHAMVRIICQPLTLVTEKRGCVVGYSDDGGKAWRRLR